MNWWPNIRLFTFLPLVAGWFARDPDVLRTVGQVLLQQTYQEPKQPRRFLIADDCFSLSDMQNRQLSVVLNSVEKAYGSMLYAL